MSPFLRTLTAASLPTRSMSLSSTLLQPTAERASEIAENLESVRSRVQSAAQDERARLVAVSKLKPASDVMAAYSDSQRHFGENYVQELSDKAKNLPDDILWHFIGALQTNKCKVLGAIPNLYAVETVDSRKKAAALDKAREALPNKKPLRVFVQVNTSSEETKAGLPPPSASSVSTPDGEGEKENVISLARYISSDECPNLKLAGLMTIGAYADSTTLTEDNPDFRRLIESRKIVSDALGLKEADLELSMGMSADFEVALRMGSTNVRVGTTIFGQRMSKAEAAQARRGGGPSAG